MDTQEAKQGTEQVEAERELSKHEEDPWESAAGLPCRLSVNLPVPGFTVRDLLELELDTVVDTQYGTNSSVPVWVNAVRIGEAEFDVFGTSLAIRINELG